MAYVNKQQGDPHSRRPQHSRRLGIPESSLQEHVAPDSLCLQSDPDSVGSSCNRSVCRQDHRPSPEVHLLAPGPSGIGNGCDVHPMDYSGESVPQSPVEPDPLLPTQVAHGTPAGHDSGASLAVSHLVSSAISHGSLPTSPPLRSTGDSVHTRPLALYQPQVEAVRVVGLR
ncbi:hypothetical protein CLU79DRAFT_717062 [Phycomyces nitens]|nr:hypothetical protein CLU79DRAFT_717062 [Phycomyces nitens]